MQLMTYFEKQTNNNSLKKIVIDCLKTPSPPINIFFLADKLMIWTCIFLKWVFYVDHQTGKVIYAR